MGVLLVFHRVLRLPPMALKSTAVLTTGDEQHGDNSCSPCSCAGIKLDILLQLTWLCGSCWGSRSSLNSRSNLVMHWRTGQARLVRWAMREVLQSVLSTQHHDEIAHHERARSAHDRPRPPPTAQQTNSMRALLSRVSRLLLAFQVELHGKYSASRLAVLTDYYETASHTRVLFAIAGTPIPCLITVFLIDLIPLDAPKEGIARNWGFWLRTCGLNGIATLCITALFHRAMRLPPMPLSHLTTAVAFVSVSSTAATIGMANVIGFPIPFNSLLSCAHFEPLIFVALAAMWRPYFRRDPGLMALVMEYGKVIGGAGMLLVLYPVYIFALGRLQSTAQGALSLLLPLTKLVTLSIVSRFFRLNPDMRAEELVFSAEVFASLFVAFTMQTSSSLLPIVILTLVDVTRAGMSLYDIIRLANDFERTQASIRLLRSASGGSVAPFLGKIVMPRDFAAACGHHEGMLQQIAALTATQDAPHVVSIMHPAPLSGVEMTATQQVHSTKRVSTRVFVGAHKIASLATTKPTWVSRWLSRPVVPAPTRLPDALVSQQLTHQEERLIKLGCHLLYVTEYIVLVEFVEVVIPTIYGIYLLTMTHLPNRQFYPQFTEMDADQHRQLVANMFVLAGIELSTLVVLNLIVWQRLRFSLVKQLAFVLERHWPTVQAKLVLWVVYVVHSTLIHTGADYTFQFKWLREKP